MQRSWAPFLRDPDLLCVAISAPTRRRTPVVLVVDRVVRRVQLDEIDDLEPRPPEQTEQLAVGQLPLDADVAGPLHATHSSPGPERASRREAPSSGAHRIEIVLLRRNQSRPPGRSRRCASGSQRCGSHQMLAPYSETREVEALREQRDILGAGLHEREVDPAPPGSGARSGCAGVDVDADGARTTPSEPGGDVRGPTAQLDDVQTVDVAQRLHDASGTPKTPHVISSRAHARLARRRVLGVRLRPHLAVATRVVREVRHGQSSPSGKNRRSSRRALAVESEPWTTFSERSVA